MNCEEARTFLRGEVIRLGLELQASQRKREASEQAVAMLQAVYDAKADFVPKAKLDASERGAAAMRAVLLRLDWPFSDDDAVIAGTNVRAGEIRAALASHAGTGFVPRADMVVEIDRLLQNEERLQVRAHNEAIEAAAKVVETRHRASWSTIEAIRALRKPDGGA